MSRDPFFDAIRDQLLPDATDTEIEILFGQYLGAQPEPVFIAHIAGDPKPQGSKRYVGGGRVIEDNPGTRAWRQSAQLQLTTYRSRQLKEPIDEAVLVQAVFCLPRPKSVRSMLPTSKSSHDLNELCRALEDALEGAGVLKNDSRITTWHARKHYAEADNNGPAITGVFLRIYKEKQ